MNISTTDYPRDIIIGMAKKISRLVRENFLLLTLLTILFIIAYQNIIPGSVVMGWDNFSVSLNPLINLKRTLFATWREYRGLGVPSDSEVTDLPRQLFFVFSSLFVPLPLLNQIYIFLSLTLGVVGVYLLTKRLLSTLSVKNLPLIEISSLIASTLYLFNLNTLATFYFPMPMYVTRFAMLPMIIYSFIGLLTATKVGKRVLLFFILVSLFGTASYLTATVFITVLFVLGTIAVSIPDKLVTSVKYLVLFLLINSFWLFPFVNYTIQKGSIIPKASTFIEVNEIQLNEAPSHFTWKKILSFYPNFFYTPTSSISTDEETYLHPLANQLDTDPFRNSFIYLFPLLYIAGALLIIFFSQKALYFRWVPLVMVISFFMLRKTYPPIGSLFSFINKTFPLFGVIFRFADTKFYPILAVTGAIAAGFLVYKFFSLLPKYIKQTTAIIAAFIIFSLGSYAYNFFFNANLISPLMYNQVPDAYYQMAEIINSDSENIRVAHLPVEITSYWKPYSWGYVGSNFLAFLLNKPILDRTFAPASTENDQVDLAILKQVENAEKIVEKNVLEEKANNLYNILSTAGVKYLILDETITPQLSLRDTKYWGMFPSKGTKVLTQELLRLGKIQIIATYRTDTAKDNQITLYTLNQTKPMTSLAQKGEFIHPKQENILLTGIVNPQTALIQSKNLSGNLMPFFQKNFDFVNEKQGFVFSNEEFSKIRNLSFTPNNNTKHAFDVLVGKDEKYLIVAIKHKPFPTDLETGTYPTVYIPLENIKDLKEDKGNFASDWHVLDINSVSNYRLAVGGVVLPLPGNLNTQIMHLGTILTKDTSLAVELYKEGESYNFDLSEFTPTEEKNCFSDSFEGYDYKLDAKSEKLILSTQNGTSCATAPGKDTKGEYFEATVDFVMKVKEEMTKNITTPSLVQKQINSTITALDTANYFGFCLIDNKSGGCLNNHQAISIKSPNPVTFPSLITSETPPGVFIYLPSINEQKVELGINSIKIKGFDSVYKEKFDFPVSYSDKDIDKNDKYEFYIPKFISKGSFYLNPAIDAMKVYNKPCDEAGTLRESKNYSNLLIQYNFGCQTGAYQDLDYDKDNFYLWHTSYNLLSGKYPKFIIKETDMSLIDEYLSIHQGYPNIPEFKSLQQGESFITNSLPEFFIDNTLKNLKFKDAYAFIYPQEGTNEEKSKLFTIFQHSETQGLFALKDFNVVEIPKAWESLILKFDNKEEVFAKGTTTEKRILPSLWKITVAPDNDNTNDYLISFNQGYDKQWKLYKTKSPLLALLGVGDINPQHVKLDGIANGWIIPAKEINDNTVLFAIYTPEKLYLIGIIITISSIIAAFALRKQKKEKKPGMLS